MWRWCFFSIDLGLAPSYTLIVGCKLHVSNTGYSSPNLIKLDLISYFIKQLFPYSYVHSTVLCLRLSNVDHYGLGYSFYSLPHSQESA